MSSLTERLHALEKIETDVANVLNLAANVLQELGKDKPSMKQVDNHSNQFLKLLNSVETELARQIAYLSQVSTGQPHEGSCYAASKVLQMAWHRLQHARNEVQRADSRRALLTTVVQNSAAQVAPVSSAGGSSSVSSSVDSTQCS